MGKQRSFCRKPLSFHKLFINLNGLHCVLYKLSDQYKRMYSYTLLYTKIIHNPNVFRPSSEESTKEMNEELKFHAQKVVISYARIAF